MDEARKSQDDNLMSKEGVIAGVLCAVIPLTVTGILLFRYLTQKGSIDSLLYWTAFVFACSIPMQIIMNIQSDKLYKQLMAEDFTPPSNKFKMLYGAAYGMMISLIGMFVVLLGLTL